MSQPEDPPDTSGEILLSASMAINAELNIADFFNQFIPILCHHSHLRNACMLRLEAWRISVNK
jgi:hypothetical protein